MESKQPASMYFRNPTRATEHVSSATKLLEKKREMFEVQMALDAQREEFKVISENIKRREHHLKRRDLDLQEQLVKFNRFVQENDSKRLKAEKRAGDEIAQRRHREVEIEDLQKQLEKNRHAREVVAAQVERDSRYQRYLEAVLEVADEFPEIKDLLMRFATLAATNSDLVARGHECTQTIEEVKAALQRYTDEKTDEILEYNNTVAALQKAYEAAESRAAHVQMEMDRRLQDAAERTLNIGQIVMASENLWNRVQSRSSIKREPSTDPVAHLATIRDYLVDATAIVTKYQASAPPAPITAPNAAQVGPEVDMGPKSGRMSRARATPSPNGSMNSGTRSYSMASGISGRSGSSVYRDKSILSFGGGNGMIPNKSSVSGSFNTSRNNSRMFASSSFIRQ